MASMGCRQLQACQRGRHRHGTCGLARALDGDLPETYPLNPAVAKYIVPDTDPRKGLRGRWGCRAIRGLSAGSVLGSYRSLVYGLKDFKHAYKYLIPRGYEESGHSWMEYEVEMVRTGHAWPACVGCTGLHAAHSFADNMMSERSLTLACCECSYNCIPQGWTVCSQCMTRPSPGQHA